jgi:hypothetical protein
MKNITIFENFRKENNNDENIEKTRYFINFILDNYDKLDYYDKFEKIAKDLLEDHGLFKKNVNKYESIKFDSRHAIKFDNIQTMTKSTKITLFSASLSSNYINNLKEYDKIEISFYLDFAYFAPSIYCYLNNSNVKSYSRIQNYSVPNTDEECRDCLDKMVNDVKKYVNNYISKYELIAIHNVNKFFDHEDI